MQLADVLSDLATLRACEAQGALNLVTLPVQAANETADSSANPSQQKFAAAQEEHDPDLVSAKQFLQLHKSLKERDHRELEDLRRKVTGIVAERRGTGLVGGFDEGY
ncbi:hypothetical protein BDZ91DRAFT_56942 [Kalaharituber pfeilii]|nr:hypothetical protein BDZ91DRAFT_56942 [Kalaharituber pfeilii]